MQQQQQQSDQSRPTLPALRRVHVVDGILQGIHVHVPNPRRQRQARLLEAYERAWGPDGRVPLKQGGSGTLTGPVLEFVNLQQSPEEAVRFTRSYGPLVWHAQYLRRISRNARPRERPRGITGLKGGIVDRERWSLPLREFWQRQKRFRAIVELVTSLQSAPDQLPARMRTALDVLPELRDEFGKELGVTDPEALRANALRYIDEHQTSAQSTLRTYAMRARVGELVSDILTTQVRAPQPRVTFDPEKGFRCLPQFNGVLDVLYFLLVEQWPAFGFCANCGRTYFKYRPDKNTCSQRCASLLGKRRWARKARQELSKQRG